MCIRDRSFSLTSLLSPAPTTASVAPPPAADAGRAFSGAAASTSATEVAEGASAAAAGSRHASISSLLLAWLSDWAGDGRDRTVDTLKGLDNRLDNAISGAAGQLMTAISGAGEPAEAHAATELVVEAVELVAQVLA